METLHTRLGEITPGTPTVVLIGEGLALVGVFDLGAAGYADTTSVDIGVIVPNCSCPNPADDDVDPDCPRCYPKTPAGMLERIAKAVAESRRWAYRAGAGPHIDGCDDFDINAAQAVLSVLLHPGRNGVLR